MASSARGFVYGHRCDFGQVSRGHRQVHVAVTDGLHAIPRQVHQTRHGGKCHLPAQRQHERFKQQRKAIQLAHPVGLREPHRAVGQAYPRYPNLQKAFVLEKVQVPQPLDLRVMDRVLARDAGVGKSRTRDKVHGNGQFTPRGVEIDTLHVPWRRDSKGCFKELDPGCIFASIRLRACRSWGAPKGCSLCFRWRRRFRLR